MEGNTKLDGAWVGAVSDLRAQLLQMLLHKRSISEREIGRYPRDGRAGMVASLSQKRLWFIDHFDGGGLAYHFRLSLRLRGTLDSGALRQALDRIADRHETLRTAFSEVEGELRQRIQPAGGFALQVVEANDLSEDQTLQLLLRHKLEESRAQFDLREGPLIRGRLLVLGDKDHVLLITMHHIISDGWSMSIFIRELSELYSAFVEQRQPALQPLPIQYADYAQWQHEPPQQALVARQMQYWRKHLEGSAPELALPMDRPRPEAQRYRGWSVPIHIDTDLTLRLKALARRRGMTLFMLLLGAWAILLSRLSGQEDVVIGTPTANRRRPELEGLIGFFANTLALRVHVSARMTLGALLDQVMEVTLGAFEHQDVPFEQIVEALRPSRSLNRHPIFQVMLVLQNTPQVEMKLPGLTITREENTYETSKFDLLMSLEECGDGICGILSFDQDLFDQSTIARWVGCFMILLDALDKGDHRSVIELPLLSAGERTQVLSTFNRTDAEFPVDQRIHEVFEAQARRTPGRVAVTHGTGQVTYAALDATANHLCAHLQRLGVGPDHLVGICMERSPQMIVGLLGILKAGGAYLPLDPNYPRERLAYMLQDAQPAAVLTQECLKAHLPELPSDVRLIGMESMVDECVAESTADEESGSTQDLLYVIYTSGSTGRPKGTAMSHRAMGNLIEWHRRNLPCGESGCRVLQFASLSFDVAFQEIFSTLCCGGTLVLLEEATRKDPGALTQLLSDQSIDRLFVPPLVLQALAEHVEASGLAPPLSDVIVAGESLRVTPAIVNFFRQIEHGRLHNHYGPTETHVVTTLTLDGDPSRWPTRPSIGRPIANTRIFILDAARQPVPVGVRGEIYIAGANLARGYLHRPELTAERFVRVGVGGASEARMYKTGDVGRWLPDGHIEYLGRNDDQVKIRGFRIELGEIESQLSRLDAVKNAVVVVREEVSGQKRLVAYLEPRNPGDLSVDDLRSRLKSLLPEHMVPSAFVQLERLPLTPNGKVNKHALPPPRAAAYGQQSYEPPQGDTERIIASVWSDLLGVERVGRHDNFFEIGGHSLLVLKALFKLNEALASNLCVADVYRNPTPMSLARLVTGHAVQDQRIDLSREATLDPAFVALEGSPRWPAQAILVTGGTGFVGRFLLNQLLLDTKARVYCLVRAESAGQATARLRQTLMQWDIWREEWEHRIHAVPGDLRSARLGLDGGSYERLSQQIDSVFHCGSSMNHLETYSMAKAANVNAVRALVEFAAHEQPKRINYISTLGVFASTSPGRAAIHELSPIDAEQHSSAAGYVASKWVGEKIVMLANDRGIACNIFRLGLIWADSQCGRYDERQRGYRMLKSALLSGYGIAGFRHPLPPTPVDYAARCVVALASRHDCGSGVFHVSFPECVPDGLFETCNRVLDRPLELLSFHAWIGRLKRLHEQGRSLPMVPLIEYAFSMDEKTFDERQAQVRANRCAFDDSRTRRALAAAGIRPPALGEEWMRRCLDSMLTRDPDLRAMRGPHRSGRANRAPPETRRRPVSD